MKSLGVAILSYFLLTRPHPPDHMIKTIASDLLQRHIETLVDDAAQWQTLIANDILWELAYAPSIGHPARLSGREEVLRHVTWFRESVDNFRFFNLKGTSVRRCGRRCRRSRGGGCHQGYRAHLLPGLRCLSAGCRNQDRAPPRILRFRASGKGDGPCDCWSRTLKTFRSFLKPA